LDHPTLPFGFEISKIIKYAGLNSDQLDLILGENLARLLRIELKPSAPKTMDSAEKMDRLNQSLVNEILAEEMGTPRNKSKLVPGPRDA
jgi:hypothetical protein